MEYSMFRKHPKMLEVMALSNADTKMRTIRDGLSKSNLSRTKLNLIAIDVYGCYYNLIDFIRLTSKLEPKGRNEITLEDYSVELPPDVREEQMATLKLADKWTNTPLPLNNIETTNEEVTQAFEQLNKFYRWIDDKLFN